MSQLNKETFTFNNYITFIENGKGLSSITHSDMAKPGFSTKLTCTSPAMETNQCFKSHSYTGGTL